jgi:hypothetical protein
MHRFAGPRGPIIHSNWENASDTQHPMAGWQTTCGFGRHRHEPCAMTAESAAGRCSIATDAIPRLTLFRAAPASVLVLAPEWPGSRTPARPQSFRHPACSGRHPSDMAPALLRRGI